MNTPLVVFIQDLVASTAKQPVCRDVILDRKTKFRDAYNKEVKKEERDGHSIYHHLKRRQISTTKTLVTHLQIQPFSDHIALKVASHRF
jgi:hypothetical protein